jgi:hypothetical protein
MVFLGGDEEILGDAKSRTPKLNLLGSRENKTRNYNSCQEQNIEYNLFIFCTQIIN